MILVFASDEADISAFDILDWLNYKNQETYFINEGKTSLKLIEFSLSQDINNVKLQIKDKLIDITMIRSYYWRRGFIGSCFNDSWKGKVTDNEVYWHLSSEHNILGVALMKMFEKKRSLGSFFSNNKENKLNSLLFAQQVGLTIPDTIITNKREHLIRFIEKQGEVITKAISNGINIFKEDSFFSQYTEDVNLDNLPQTDFFFETLFQEKLKKKYELRVFYLNGEFYSMAIFSQNDEKTNTDFRKYNWNRPNRMVPYRLPMEIRNKLKKFMKLVELDTGSIDLVYTKEGEYVFLEVNPVGQFGMVSRPCNYYIEKKIAEYLSN